jgi:phenylalanyl-tRNA synthetase beta chain
MKVILSWLREYVDVPGTAEDIAATMSVRGFAVEGIEPLDGGDAVIDFEVTANRPDCMSVVGIAREVATAYGLRVRRAAIRTAAAGPASTRTVPAVPRSSAHATDGDAAVPPPPADAPDGGGPVPGLHLASLKTVDQGEIGIDIEAPALCARYAGAVADVTVAASPEWMQARLRACGIRPISNIVDITNYVLLELGQPMHAFDAARLEGHRIRVRTASPGETIRTLDGQVRELTGDMLVIADAVRPVAVAGVMGGADSEVSAATTRIVLESAYFDPLSVRRTSKAIGLKPEASMRFERGADPRLPVTAMERACALLEAVGAGTAHGTVIDRYPRRIEPRTVRLRRARVTAILGVAVPDEDVRRILEGLGFALREAEGGWEITVPTRRVDVLREVDLIEDIARHHGFDRIPPTFPAVTSAPPPVDPRITQSRRLRAVLTGAGFYEAVTFGFMAEGAAAAFAPAADLVPIANPLSETFAVLRPSLLPGLVDAIAHNRRREQRDVRLFEIGARFRRSDGERRALACAWTGVPGGDHWSTTARELDFFDMKGVVDRVADALGVELRADAVPEPWLVPGRSAALFAGSERVGLIGQLDPGIVDRHKLPAADAVYVAEIDLDAPALAPEERRLRVAPLPRYPSVTRDLSVLLDATIPAASIRQTVRAAGPPTLVAVHEFDRYHGKGIPGDKVSLSLRLVFRAPDRTLTDGEVQSAMERVLLALTGGHGAVQR